MNCASKTSVKRGEYWQVNSVLVRKWPPTHMCEQRGATSGSGVGVFLRRESGVPCHQKDAVLDGVVVVCRVSAHADVRERTEAAR